MCACVWFPALINDVWPGIVCSWSSYNVEKLKFKVSYLYIHIYMLNILDKINRVEIKFNLKVHFVFLHTFIAVMNESC